MANEILNFYRFHETDPQEAADFFYVPAEKRGLLGTVLTAPEGWNVTLWGESDRVAGFLDDLQGKDLAPEAPEVKKMPLNEPPFKKLVQKVKQEIIKFGVSVDVADGQGTFITPDQLHSMLRHHGEDIVMLDVRNSYEKDAGTFMDAMHLGIESFGEFPTAAQQVALPSDKTIVAFCTGGIRCEKAVPYLRSMGHNNVLQVEGGIWRYLEKYPHGFFKGNCFWFDEREDS